MSQSLVMISAKDGVEKHAATTAAQVLRARVALRRERVLVSCDGGGQITYYDTTIYATHDLQRLCFHSFYSCKRCR
mgnify:CR=1 FL=1